MSKTISITIPDKLEKDLREAAERTGISRSRFIGNLLLDWQKAWMPKAMIHYNNCAFNKGGECTKIGIACKVPQFEAETCSDYKGTE
jgi:hypothetical protein